MAKAPKNRVRGSSRTTRPDKKSKTKIAGGRAAPKPGAARVVKAGGLPRARAAAPQPKGLFSAISSFFRSFATPPAAVARAAKAAPSIGIAIKGRMGPRYDEILSAGALEFLTELHRKFDARRRALLAARAERQKRFDAGELPDFLPHTRSIREGRWSIAPIPADLLDRRVEITGPVDRKMIVNALNSGASVFMADFEDANAPTWANNLEGQINLKDRWAGKINFTDSETGKAYRLSHKPAVLIVRPRGWHLDEGHVRVDGAPISGALFDLGLYLFHNFRALQAKATGPYFYLPKLETHQEARLWNDVFVYAQQRLGIPQGTIKTTVLIETLPAAFEMDEILWELRDHITGLNAGRWDYIFSFVKKFAKNPNYILPDRSQVVMGKAFLGHYAALLVKTCHRRGAFAMDLMRYGPDAPKNIMDYLFVELLEWGRAQGYAAFEFGMAPLAGLDDRPLAPVMSRLGRVLFETGEDLYNFQGVRRYKDKYDPVWRPRYIGAPSRWRIPFMLAHVGLLSSGGMRALAKRPRKDSARASAPAGREAQQVGQVHEDQQ